MHIFQFDYIFTFGRENTQREICKFVDFIYFVLFYLFIVKTTFIIVLLVADKGIFSVFSQSSVRPTFERHYLGSAFEVKTQMQNLRKSSTQGNVVQKWTQDKIK